MSESDSWLEASACAIVKFLSRFLIINVTVYVYRKKGVQSSDVNRCDPYSTDHLSHHLKLLNPKNDHLKLNIEAVLHLYNIIR